MNTKDRQRELDSLKRKFIIAKEGSETDLVLSQILSIVPNNYELGELIRSLYATRVKSYEQNREKE